MARTSLRRSSTKRRRSFRSSGTRSSFRKSLQDGLMAAKEMNESIWRRMTFFLRKDGVSQYMALRRAALFFTMCFWTYFGMISVMCHMADECRMLEKTVQGIEQLNIFLYGLLFASLTYGTIVFMLSAADMMLKSAMLTVDGAGAGLSRARRITAGSDPEFMSSSMVRPRYRLSEAVQHFAPAPLPPPASQSARVGMAQHRRSSANLMTATGMRGAAGAAGMVGTEKSPYWRSAPPKRRSSARRSSSRRSKSRGRRASSRVGSRRSGSRARSGAASRPLTQRAWSVRSTHQPSRSQSLSTNARGTGGGGSGKGWSYRRRTYRVRAPSRTRVAVSVPRRISRSRPVVARVTETQDYYTVPGLVRRPSTKRIEQQYTLRPPSLSVKPRGSIVYRPPSLTVTTKKKIIPRRSWF
jgi:hypothetical protein